MVDKSRTAWSYKTGWETPRGVFDPLDREFRFTLDAAASAENTLCTEYLTEEQDALRPDCRWAPGPVWLNPPYGRNMMPRWLEKAYQESMMGSTVVALLPANTDVGWFHDWVLGKAELRWVRGRLQFLLDGVVQGNNPGGSVIAIYRPFGISH